jgi:hypothetical protein
MSPSMDVEVSFENLVDFVLLLLWVVVYEELNDIG